MNTISMQVVGLNKFKSKKGNNVTIVYYVSEPFNKSIEGSFAGQFFYNGDDPLVIGENYTAFVGYDRTGNYGVIGII